MDKVNVMLADRRIDAETAVRVRMYFHHARALHRVREYRELEAMMSLKLRGEVASAAQRGWVSRVWYLADAHADLLRDISQLLAALVFAPKELMDLPEALFTVRRGLAAKRGKPLIRGSIGGADFVCASVSDMDTTAPVTLTHVEVLSLRREDLFDVLPDYPATLARVRFASKFYRWRKKIIDHALERRRARLGSPPDAGGRGLMSMFGAQQAMRRSSFVRTMMHHGSPVVGAAGAGLEPKRPSPERGSRDERPGAGRTVDASLARARGHDLERSVEAVREQLSGLELRFSGFESKLDLLLERRVSSASLAQSPTKALPHAE
jgi:hypothetical protein